MALIPSSGKINMVPAYASSILTVGRGLNLGRSCAKPRGSLRGAMSSRNHGCSLKVIAAKSSPSSSFKYHCRTTVCPKEPLKPSQHPPGIPAARAFPSIERERTTSAAVAASSSAAAAGDHPTVTADHEAPVEADERRHRGSAWAWVLLPLARTLTAAAAAFVGLLVSLAAAVPVHAARQAPAPPASPGLFPQWLSPSAWIESLRAALPYAVAAAALLLVLVAVVLALRRVWPQPPLPMISEGCQTVRDALKQVYFEKVRPLEVELAFENFHSPCFTAADFNAKPSVLLLGQYSTGKTTFIKHLLGRDYPGMLVGPEPTTDRFVVIGNGNEDKRIPGNTVVITNTKPYQALATFGEGFLSRFEEVQFKHETLEGISLIDTPGVLSGEKQRLGRAYNFVDVCSWFASRSDMVLLLFDPFKLDISDEFRQVIEHMKDHHDKIRVVLNKANQVSNEELMRVYGALMWSLAKVLHSPEVCRVYTGSFADQQTLHPSHGSGEEDSTQTPNPPGGARQPGDSASGKESFAAAGKVTSKAAPGSAGLDKGTLGEKFFAREQAELIRDLKAIPRSNRDRKISEFTKRVRAAKTHLILVHHLRRRLPLFQQRWAEENMLQNIEFEFARIKSDVNIRIYGLAPGDFPSAASFRDTVLAGNSIQGFRAMSDREFKRKLAILDDVLQRELPHISSMEEQ